MSSVFENTEPVEGMEEEKKRREEESQRKAQEIEEQGRKAREEREKQRKIEAEKKERDLQEQRAEEERQRRRNEEIARIQREKEEERLRLENEKKSSGGGKWVFGVIIIFAVLALGWYGTQDSSSSAISTPQKTITNSIGMEFVLIPAGEFNMGSPSNEVGRDEVEEPVHRVKLEKAFYMGKFEVTRKQWLDVNGSYPLFFSVIKGDKLPITGISWYDVQEFIKKINEKEGGSKYRLPTEAEWEYAARAGTTTRYSFGDDESLLGDYSTYGLPYDTNGLYEVGQKKPNPWGLYDVHGNVFEFVQDKWHADYNGAPTDGSSWESGVDSTRVMRGGCNMWKFNMGIKTFTYKEGCRSAIRNHFEPDSYGGIGFRLLRDL